MAQLLHRVSKAQQRLFTEGVAGRLLTECFHRWESIVVSSEDGSILAEPSLAAVTFSLLSGEVAAEFCLTQGGDLDLLVAAESVYVFVMDDPYRCLGVLSGRFDAKSDPVFLFRPLTAYNSAVFTAAGVPLKLDDRSRRLLRDTWREWAKERFHYLSENEYLSQLSAARALAGEVQSVVKEHLKPPPVLSGDFLLWECGVGTCMWQAGLGFLAMIGAFNEKVLSELKNAGAVGHGDVVLFVASPDEAEFGRFYIVVLKGFQSAKSLKSGSSSVKVYIRGFADVSPIGSVVRLFNEAVPVRIPFNGSIEQSVLMSSKKLHEVMNRTGWRYSGEHFKDDDRGFMLSVHWVEVVSTRQWQNEEEQGVQR